MNRTNCYNTSVKDPYIKEWTDNKTTDTFIDISVNSLIPDAIYTKWNATHYQWCGPILMIAEYFSKLTKTKLSRIEIDKSYK